MKYIIIHPGQGMTAAQRAKAISIELERLSRPSAAAKDIKGLLPLQNHATKDLAALAFVSGYKLRIDKRHDIAKLITLLDSEIKLQEIQALIKYLSVVPQVMIDHLIPSTTQVEEEQYLIDNNWIELPE
jgi:hypothetical protein